MSLITLEIVQEKIQNWEPQLKDPLWYEKIVPGLVELWKSDYNPDDKTKIRELVYGFFEEKLYSGSIALASEGPDFDQWRQPIDTLVIHHTKGPSGVTWKQLSTIGFLRQYALDFCRYEDQYGIKTRGQAIWSNHFREVDGQKVPVFYAYHWLVREDGSVDRMLNDEDIGWQAGNKETNCRSVGIAFDGDFSKEEPNRDMLEGLQRLIKNNYGEVSKERILGHLEVNLKKECPGSWFMEGGKEKILGGL